MSRIFILIFSFILTSSILVSHCNHSETFHKSVVIELEIEGNENKSLSTSGGDFTPLIKLQFSQLSQTFLGLSLPSSYNYEFTLSKNLIYHFANTSPPLIYS